MANSQSSSEKSQSNIRIACKEDRARKPLALKRQASEKIVALVAASDIFLSAKNIAVYVPMKSEVDTWPLIKCAWRMKKRVFAPIAQKSVNLQFRQITADSKYSTSKMGISEPVDGDFVPTETLDLVLTPLVAFDSQNNRIGMGGGYYDRTFAFLQQRNHAKKPLLIGIAFESQRVEKIAPNPWDIPLFSVFSECGNT